MDIKEITEGDFEHEVIDSREPVVVDFSAQWCGPCQMMQPELEALAHDKPELKIVKVDIDMAPELVKKYCITNIPLVAKFVHGRMAESSLGLTTKGELEAKLQL